MKVVADESVDKQIVDRLRSDGHEIVFISELEPGINDDLVLQRSRDLGALLLTADKDFGELVFRQHLLHSGVMLIRLAGLKPEAKAELVAAVFKDLGDGLSHQFAVLSRRALRLRKGQLQ